MLISLVASRPSLSGLPPRFCCSPTHWEASASRTDVCACSGEWGCGSCDRRMECVHCVSRLQAAARSQASVCLSPSLNSLTSLFTFPFFQPFPSTVSSFLCRRPPCLQPPPRSPISLERKANVEALEDLLSDYQISADPSSTFVWKLN